MTTLLDRSEGLSRTAPAQEIGTSQLLRAIAASGLHGSLLPWPEEALDDGSWRSLLAGVGAHRLSGLLLHALGSDALPATAEQVAQARCLRTQAMGKALLREAALLEAVEALDGAGIAYRALRGVAPSHVVYGDPATRPRRGLGVLVPSDRFDEALRVLTALEYGRASPPLRPGFDGTFGQVVRLVRCDGMSVGLHRTLATGHFGLTIPLDSLFQFAAELSIAARRILALAPEVHFLHCCYDVALEGASSDLLSLREVAQQVLDDDLDVDRVLALAGAWAGEAPVAVAIRLSWLRLALADAVPLSAWAHRYTLSNREKRLLAGYRSSYAHRALDSLQAIKSIGAKTAFLRAVALPDPVWLAHHNHHRLGWLGRGAASVLRPRLGVEAGA